MTAKLRALETGRRSRGWLSASLLATLLVAACGGGGAPGAPEAASPQSVSSTANPEALKISAALEATAATLGATPAPASKKGGLVPPSNRSTINLGQTPWRYLKDTDPPTAMNVDYDDSAANTKEVWASVGVPQSPSDNDTFINTKSGGGQGQLTGNILWYRKHFKLDPSYSNRKIFVEFEGAQMGAQVYVNGVFMPGNSLINPQATHVIGFQPFIVDITSQVKFDGSDNVMAVKVARGDRFFDAPNFSGAFRFGEGDTGLFRPVWMYIKDRVYIPENTWAVVNTWGTYVSTLSADDKSASIRVQTNVRNEYTSSQTVTLTTQIVDAKGKVVATTQDTKVLASAPSPATPAKIAPEVAPPPATFDQTLTVNKPELWYPNTSLYGKPYMYKVIHTVSIDGVVVDATESPLGIRTITWDQNFPIINGHPHYLWGASGRYDYPALGAAMPEEQKWRDVELLAEAGGSLYRPGHSSEGPEFLDAADAYGVMVVQPSGDGENGFTSLCPGLDRTNCSANTNDVELKKETHRDMIVHDRNNPSVLSWEADNGSTDTAFAQSLKALSRTWEPIHTRAQADRTPNPANGDILGCSGNGCDIGVKRSFPGSPTWGSEYWGDGVGRALYDYELAFAAPYLNNYAASVRAKSFGIAHWYLADTPGEINTQTDGTSNELVRGNGASMMDANRIPRLLYYAYQAAWSPFQVKPVVKLAYHWNRFGNVTVNGFSNCPSVRLLINGQQQGGDQFPNSQTSDSSSNLTQSTTLLPAQVHWNVSWAAGTLTAQCLDTTGRVASDANGNPVIDEITTAGAPDHIQLTVTPEVKRPGGQAFKIVANGTDAAFITATVVDAHNVRVPDAKSVITFSVTGPGTYRGGSDHYVTPDQPESFHAPGDPNLSAEGGLTRIAVKSQFTPGVVTVNATSPGLKSGTTTFKTVAAAGPAFDGKTLVIAGTPANSLAIVVPPATQTVTIGQTATFTVEASGVAPLSFQWKKNGVDIAGATSFSYTTPATSSADNNATYSVQVSNPATKLTSAAATLKVVAPTVPTIVRQPKAQTVVAGDTAQFSVKAAGSPTLTYQWLDKAGNPIAGATNAIYTTPAVLAADDGSTFSVVVTNSAGHVNSTPAKLTVAAATKPTIVTQPTSLAVSAGQSVNLSVVANGSAPLHYQWKLEGANVGTDAPTYAVVSAQSSDAGNYTVTVSNEAGSVVSQKALLSVSGGNGPNLALNKTALESSEQGADLNAKFAFDGDTKVSRWASASQTDPSWVGVDLGAKKSFDRVVITWENAYADQYQIQTSNDSTTWTDALPAITGHGGTESISFPTVQARYVRMLGTHRFAQPYGYSLYEMQVYSVPQCGGSGERYTMQPAKSGTYHSTIPGIPDGPYVPTVIDNVNKLVWQQYVTTFTQQGAQFTQPIAEQYCASLNMRVPTQAEALTIAGGNYSSCAFPNPWTTWTTTADPNDATRAFFVSSAGVSSSQIINNAPGWALCVSAAPKAAASALQQSLSQ